MGNRKAVTLRAITISVIVGVLAMVLAYAALIVYLTLYAPVITQETAASIGESFGVLSAVFAGLAFAGVILTIVLQRSELSESREIFRIQRFEGSFYRLLSLYRRNLDDILVVDSGNDTSYRSIDALNYVCKQLNKVMQKYSPLLESTDFRPLYEVQLFIEIQKLIRKQGRYLGTLTNMLDLIERDLPTESERIPYWDIISSQLTSNEARYLFYCCLVAPEGDKLRKLLHRAGLMGERMVATNLSTTHRSLYERIHGISLPRARTQLVTPYPQGEFRRLKRKARKLSHS